MKWTEITIHAEQSPHELFMLVWYAHNERNTYLASADDDKRFEKLNSRLFHFNIYKYSVLKWACEHANACGCVRSIKYASKKHTRKKSPGHCSKWRLKYFTNIESFHPKIESVLVKNATRCSGDDNDNDNGGGYKMDVVICMKFLTIPWNNVTGGERERELGAKYCKELVFCSSTTVNVFAVFSIYAIVGRCLTNTITPAKKCHKLFSIWTRIFYVRKMLHLIIIITIFVRLLQIVKLIH